MKSRRILLLVHELLVPPENPSKKEVEEAEWKTEWDVMVTLREAGHDVCVLGIGAELQPIRRVIEEWKPHIAFNLLEEFAGQPTFDHVVVSFMEILNTAYTGCNPRGLVLARDKALAKKILAWHRIAAPDFAVFARERAIRRPKALKLPLLIKSLTREASEGISSASVVRSDEEMKERVEFIHEKIGTDAIAETYIDGREFYVAVLGNERLEVFPTWELFLDKLPEGMPKIATERVKFDAKYQKKHRIMSGEAKIDPALQRVIQRMCKRAYRALGLSGYARMDLRLDEEGRPWILEANPNPQIAYGEDFAESAHKAGVGYGNLLERMINLGTRYRRRL